MIHFGVSEKHCGNSRKDNYVIASALVLHYFPMKKNMIHIFTRLRYIKDHNHFMFLLYPLNTKHAFSEKKFLPFAIIF